MTKLQGSLFSLTLVSAFGYFVYRVFLKGREQVLTLRVPTPIPGVDREVNVLTPRIP